MSESTHSIRISAPSQATKGEIIELKAVIQHDMESGYRRDEYGKQIPRLILVRFQCLYLGEPVFSAEFFPAVAANPFLNFYTKATESGTLEFVWIDQDGRRYAESVQLEVRTGNADSQRFPCGTWMCRHFSCMKCTKNARSAQRSDLI